MKHIKLFEKFNEMFMGGDLLGAAGSYNFIGEYKSDQFDKFTEDVHEWEKSTRRSCKWKFTTGKSKEYWDKYVDHGKKMVLVESVNIQLRFTQLYGLVLDSDGKVKYCVNDEGHQPNDVVIKRIMGEFFNGDRLDRDESIASLFGISSTKKRKEDYSTYSQSQIQSLLDKALDNRDYELAKKVSKYLKESKKTY